MSILILVVSHLVQGWNCGSDCATSWSFHTIYYSGLREEDFSNVFIIYGRSGHLCHVTLTIYINLVLGISCDILLRHSLDLPYNYSFPLPMDFPRAIVLCLKIVVGRRTDAG